MRGSRIFTLRFRLLLLAAVALLPAFGLMLQATSDRRRVAAHNAQQEVLRLARLSAFAEQRFVGATRQLLITLAYLPEVRGGDWPVCNALFSQLLTHYPGYNNLGVVTLEGKVTCSGVPLTSSLTFPDRVQVCQAAESRDLAIGNYHKGLITGKNTIAFDYPVIDERGDVVAVAFAARNLDWLGGEESEVLRELPAGSAFAEVGDDGVSLVHIPPGVGGGGRPYADQQVLTRARAEGEGIFEARGADGIVRVHAFASVVSAFNGGPRFVILSIPREALFAGIDDQLKRNLAWLSVAALLALGGAWIGGDVFLLRRIRALVSTTSRLRAGDLSARTGIAYGPGELSQLARSFDEMAAVVEDRDARLREAENKYRTLVEQVPAIIYAGALDRASPMPYVSPRIEEVLGFSVADFESDADLWRKQLHASDRERVIAELATSRTGDQTFASEYRMVTRDGGVRWFRDQARIVRDEGGHPLFLQGVMLDITERKRAEEERRLLAEAVEQAAEAIFITDATGAIQYVNPAFVRTTGYSRGEAMGQNPRMLKSGIHDQEFYRELWETVCRGDTWHGRLVDRRKDGKLCQNEMTISPVRDAAGQIGHFVAVKRDVSQEVELETQLRQAQKMEAMGELAGGVAHDFNNLLQAMLSQAQLLRAHHDEPEKCLVRLQELEDQVGRGAQLTRQLLRFSRRETPKRERLDLNEVARGTVHFLLRRLVRENVASALSLTDGLLPVEADRGQLEQVLMNLVVNACDAMPEGGCSVAVCSGQSAAFHPGMPCSPDADQPAPGLPGFRRGGRALTDTCSFLPNQSLHASRHRGNPVRPARQRPSRHSGRLVISTGVEGDAQVWLAVEDSGHGIPEEIRDRIFEPFFTTKEAGKGTGLGLSVVAGVVTHHGGKVEVESVPGGGTRMRVVLPRVAAPPDAEEAGAAPEAMVPGGHGERVLVVEDEPAAREGLAEILDSFGYAVAAVGSAEEAGLLPQEPAFAVLLTDVMLPGATGTALAVCLRERWPDLKVVLMSGYSQDETVSRSVAAGAVRFLQKPFDMATLAREICAALHER